MSAKQSQEYRGNTKHAWEDVTPCAEVSSTARLRVPGGWLYHVSTAYPEAVTMAFVPMPEVVKHKV